MSEGYEVPLSYRGDVEVIIEMVVEVIVEIIVEVIVE